MAITIRRWWNDDVVYESATAETVRAGVLEE